MAGLLAALALAFGESWDGLSSDDGRIIFCGRCLMSPAARERARLGSVDESGLACGRASRPSQLGVIWRVGRVGAARGTSPWQGHTGGRDGALDVHAGVRLGGLAIGAP